MKSEKDRLAAEVDSFLKGLLAAAGLDLEFRCEPEEEVITARLYGHDVGMVLSNNARLLYAINHILNRVFYEKASRQFSLIVDCNEYRATRAEELQVLARKAAESVKRSGNLYPLEPMPASERREVHLALAQEPGVSTESEGVGLQRRVVILPAK